MTPLDEARQIITEYHDRHLSIPAYQAVGFPTGLVDDGCLTCEKASLWLAANPKDSE